MKWSQPADRNVVEAVVATFCEPVERVRTLLLPLRARQWERTYYWLDASGMALYFLDRVKSDGMADAVPASVIARLEQNFTDNRDRSANTFREFAGLNSALEQAGVEFCNLKGFTLSPDSCPDMALRCQLDIDLLVDGRHLEQCREVLVGRGYALRGSTNTVWEFKTERDDLPKIADLYKPKQQRCVEIHFACGDDPQHAPTRDARLDRLARFCRDGVEFPALNPVDQFVGQATHLLGHLCGPCTRLAWLLEFKRHIDVRREDVSFWAGVVEQATANRISGIAIGVSALLAEQVLGAELPAILQSGPVAHLPEGVQLWVERYGRRAFVGNFPGTKLNLLLREQIHAGQADWQGKKRSALLPLHRAPRLLHVQRSAGLWKRLRGEIYQLRFVLFRLRFHIVEGLRYAIEAWRWKRHLEQCETKMQHERPRCAQTTAGRP